MGFEELAPFICKGDARFFNLETTLNHPGEACGSALSLNIPGGRKRGLLSQVLFRRRLKSRTTAMVPWPEPVP